MFNFKFECFQMILLRFLKPFLNPDQFFTNVKNQPCCLFNILFYELHSLLKQLMTKSLQNWEETPYLGNKTSSTVS